MATTIKQQNSWNIFEKDMKKKPEHIKLMMMSRLKLVKKMLKKYFPLTSKTSQKVRDRKARISLQYVDVNK